MKWLLSKTWPVMLAGMLLLGACKPMPPAVTPEQPDTVLSAEDQAFLADLQERTFRWFWETSNPVNGLVPDRAPRVPFASIAAVGFGLTAYPVGAERGYITREQARDRTLATLRFFWNAPQGDAESGMTGYRGFFYHFLDMNTGVRYRDVELSTIDTALLMGGVLFAQSYFDRNDPGEAEIRRLADSLYRRVDWTWTQLPVGRISMGWKPTGGLFNFGYEGYDEAMILYLLALGSPTHPVTPEAWNAFTSTYRWGTFYGYTHLNFAPLFGHQYSHIWVDFRGIQDAFMRRQGIDYFENSRRATISQREYAIDNPRKFRDYGPDIWGLTACDGPGNNKGVVDGDSVQFHGYWARGASLSGTQFEGTNDDGTIAPTATGGSVPFAPGITVRALRAMRARYGDLVWNQYGFADAFNPSYRAEFGKPEAGVVDPQHGWFDDQQLGIDQGPIVLMIENHRSGLIWQVMRKNPYIREGLRRAGFTGGWLNT